MRSATLMLFKQVFSHVSRFSILVYLLYFFCTFPPVLTTRVTYFGLRLDNRIVGPKELKAQLEELDVYHISSSFLRSYEKMTDVDINPLGDHDKTDSHPDETGENIPLTQLGPMGRGTWKQEREQQTSFGGGNPRMEVIKEHVKGLYPRLSESMGFFR